LFNNFSSCTSLEGSVITTLTNRHLFHTHERKSAWDAAYTPKFLNKALRRRKLFSSMLAKNPFFEAISLYGLTGHGFPIIKIIIKIIHK
jgi:hypothetical protein